MHYRIGVNLGEIVEDGGSLYGEGVNVAARMEALAEVGGICISGKVFDEVEGKVDGAFDFLGEKQVKNIARPVPAYRLRDAAEVAPQDDIEAPTPAVPATADKPSIAVLPFDNMSGDTEQDYFVDGITEDIITVHGMSASAGWRGYIATPRRMWPRRNGSSIGPARWTPSLVSPTSA